MGSSIQSQILEPYQQAANWAVEVSIWLAALLAVSALLGFFIGQFRTK